MSVPPPPRTQKPRPSTPGDRTAVPGARLRADAARAMAAVAFDGASLRRVLAEANPRIDDARDRALFAASLFAASRGWLRYTAAVDALTERPLPAKARTVKALLVVGIAQIAALGLAEYAVVAACVDAAHALGAARHAGLVNAVLRRFLRERTAIDARLDAEPVTRYAHPRWLIDAIRADWPAEADAILAENDRAAPLTLRVNRRRSTRERLLESLRAAGVDADAPPSLSDAIVLAHSADVTRLPGYAEGEFSVQDGAAQRVIELLDLAPAHHVLDACAAPGGKAAHILECADVALVALDRDAERLPRVRENLARLGLVADVRAGDAAAPEAWWSGRAFDRILLDAPCSATGIVRRQPDIKLHRRGGDIAVLAAAQRQLLTALWPLLAPGGRLVYATCSVLRAENECVVEAFVAATADARALPVAAAFGHASGVGRQRLPGEEGMDGFFYAVVEKNR